MPSPRSPRSATPPSSDFSSSHTESLPSPPVSKTPRSAAPLPRPPNTPSRAIDAEGSLVSASTASSFDGIPPASSPSSPSFPVPPPLQVLQLPPHDPSLRQPRALSWRQSLHPRTPHTQSRRALSCHAGTQLLELRLSAENLRNRDRLSLSDPFAVLSADHFGVGAQRLGVTETVYDDLNPAWVTRFLFDVRDARRSSLVVEIYDRDSRRSGDSLSRHTFLGRAQVDLEDVVAAPCSRVTVDLCPEEGARKCRADLGRVSVFSEVLADERAALGVARMVPRSRDLRSGRLVMRVNCTALKKRVGIGAVARTRQFFEIQRRRFECAGATSWTTIYRSEDGKRLGSDGYIQFKTASMPEISLHNSEPDRELRFVFYSRCVRKEHDRICYAQTSAAELAKCNVAYGRRYGASVPLVGDFQDYDGIGTMVVVGSRRDEKAGDVLVLDINVDIFMLPGSLGFVSALNRNFTRPTVLGSLSSRMANIACLH